MPKSKKTVLIGSVSFDPERGTFAFEDGSETNLRPQTAQVLAILAANSGQLVSKETLMDAVWTDTHVTDDSLVQCISEIRKALGPTDGALLKTVPRQGYRLEVGPAADPSASDPDTEHGSRRSSGLVLAALTFVLAVIAVAFWGWPRSAPEGSIAVAVLPFENLSNDPGQVYLSDGMAVDLITDLSRVSALVVISRTSSFAFKDTSSDIREIADTLGASHVVEGSVQKVEERLRITARLVDAKTGAQLWSDRYDRDANQIFAMQDEVRGEIISALRVRLTSSEKEQLAQGLTESPEAYDFYLRGLREMSFFDAASNLRAEVYFERAIAIDPVFAAAYSQLAQIYSLAIEAGWNGATGSAPLVERVLQTARKGVQLDPELPLAHWSLGRILSRGYVNRLDEAAIEMARSIELDPNFADGHAMQTSILVKIGREDEALAHMEKALRLNPQPPYWYWFNLGQVQILKGDFEAAAESLRRARDGNPSVSWPRRYLISVYGLLGMTDEAEWEIFELEAMGFDVTVTDFKQRTSVSDQRYLDLIIDGARKAGVPED